MHSNYIFTELYKKNDKGLTKQNVLETRNGSNTQKIENKHTGFFYFLHHFGPSIAGMYLRFVFLTFEYDICLIF